MCGIYLFMCSLHLQVLEDLLGVSTLGLFNDVAALALVGTRARDYGQNQITILKYCQNYLKNIFINFNMNAICQKYFRCLNPLTFAGEDV